jgi:hypothetical protein
MIRGGEINITGLRSFTRKSSFISFTKSFLPEVPQAFFAEI